MLYLLNYIPERRGNEFDTVEDVPVLMNTMISVKMAIKPHQILQVLKNVPLRFTYANARIETPLLELCGHQMIAIVS